MTTQEQTIAWTTGQKAVLGLVLVLWFIAAAIIGTSHILLNTEASLIPPIVVTVFVPVAAFIGLYLGSTTFRRFVLAQDIETLTMLQNWRIIGFAFLPLYFYGALPGLFAWPAGLGDVAIGLAAPIVLLRMRRDPAYATSAGLVRYHYLGLLDFVVAAGTAGLAAGAYAELTPDGVTSAAIDVWPLNMFPSFAVPIFVILHVVVLLKVRALRRQEPQQARSAAVAA